jgi:hypothetical protein
MKKILVFISLLTMLGLKAQNNYFLEALPPQYFNPMVQESTNLDLVFLERGSSVSMDGNNVQMFISFMDTLGAVIQPQLKPVANIFWTKGAVEMGFAFIYMAADYGYMVFDKGEKKYALKLTPQGYGFMLNNLKKP